MNFGTLALIAIAILLLTPLSRILLAAVFGKSIGKAALERQPDTIHLESTDTSKLRHAARVDLLASQYVQCGFEDAGAFAIPEMPGVCVRLLAHPGRSMYATIYDHPVAGVFYDIVSRYTGGSSWTCTTARPTGIRHRDNVHMTHLPGTDPGALIEAARRERPAQGLRPVAKESAKSDFESAYAEYMAWMKQRGLSTGEVVDVARRRVA